MAHDQKYKRFEEQASEWQNYKIDATDQPIRVALFGLGRIGWIHLSKIYANPRVKLLYCVESSEQRCDYVKAKWHLNDVKFIVSEKGDQVFNDPDVDAVVIGTPTQTHYEILITALNAGKHVLCEKPLASNYEDMERCYRLAREKGVVLLTAFNRRFDPSFNEINNRLVRGEIGPIHVVKTVSRDSPRPSLEYITTSGGIYHDCVVHDIDMLLWLTGEYPVRVYANGVAFHDDIRALGDHDCAVIMLSFPSGAVGMIDVDRNSNYGYDQRIEVFGPKGMLSGNNLRTNGVVGETVSGAFQTPIYYSFVSRYAESYANEWEHFVDCVQGKDECSIKEHSCLAVYIITEAAENSARTGEPVTLTWETSKFPVSGPRDKK